MGDQGRTTGRGSAYRFDTTKRRSRGRPCGGKCCGRGFEHLAKRYTRETRTRTERFTEDLPQGSWGRCRPLLPHLWPQSAHGKTQGGEVHRGHSRAGVAPRGAGRCARTPPGTPGFPPWAIGALWAPSSGSRPGILWGGGPGGGEGKTVVLAPEVASGGGRVHGGQDHRRDPGRSSAHTVGG